MAIKYVCRGCNYVLAEFQDGTDENQLGLGLLTPEERMHMVKEDGNGNMTIEILCEYCQDAINYNPELSLLSSPIQ